MFNDLCISTVMDWGYLNVSTAVSAQLVRLTKLKHQGLRSLYVMDVLNKFIQFKI